MVVDMTLQQRDPNQPAIVLHDMHTVPDQNKNARMCSACTNAGCAYLHVCLMGAGS